MSASADRGGERRCNTNQLRSVWRGRIPPSAPFRGHLPLKGGEGLYAAPLPEKDSTGKLSSPVDLGLAFCHSLQGQDDGHSAHQLHPVSFAPSRRAGIPEQGDNGYRHR